MGYPWSSFRNLLYLPVLFKFISTYLPAVSRSLNALLHQHIVYTNPSSVVEYYYCYNTICFSITLHISICLYE
ncbi:hypothetical protein BT96DRAFT_496958 [Gymnopus androsaceus JB14]|uniref:Uncharacterized protein n=1 Tax=Gymnopus androsaceus JB14 TaxID=1447944 RepID=A0A6A4GNS3_9AGAR|nr:hypothetical protein BT96DRAFT_496958 [Gymnopus androsaceus JB14]